MNREAAVHRDLSPRAGQLRHAIPPRLQSNMTRHDNGDGRLRQPAARQSDSACLRADAQQQRGELSRAAHGSSLFSPPAFDRRHKNIPRRRLLTMQPELRGPQSNEYALLHRSQLSCEHVSNVPAVDLTCDATIAPLELPRASAQLGGGAPERREALRFQRSGWHGRAPLLRPLNKQRPALVLALFTRRRK